MFTVISTPLEMTKIADHAFRTAGYFITIHYSLLFPHWGQKRYEQKCHIARKILISP